MSADLPALALRGLSKTFGATRALDGVDLTVARGEVHGLLGQNGSGKSTLIKCLSGFHAPDPGGTLSLYGGAVKLPLEAGAYRGLGLSFVHQHLGLIPDLSVTENMRLDAFATETRWRIDWKAEAAAVAEACGRYGVELDPAAPVAALAQVDRCLLAIVRAMEEMEHAEGGVLVLDEPTPFLPRAGVERLFALVRAVVARGASVIFVSHDIDEVREITDRATVLRDGRVAGSVVTAEAGHDAFVEMIVGRKVAAFHLNHDHVGGETAVEVEGLSGRVADGVSFALRRGEVLGLTGLIGAGFDEIPALLSGATRAASGRLTLGGEAVALTEMTPRRALACGVAYLPADRLAASGAGSLSVEENMALPSYETFRRGWGLNMAALRDWARRLVAEHDVRPGRADLPLASLSGGNQQKALLAKWLETGPRLLLLDEPTQGVDVGARQQVYRALERAAQAGTTIICASTDLEQLAQICDRVLVFAKGRISADLRGSAVTQEAIADACYRGGEARAA